MPLDPIDPGAMATASVGLTKSQLRQLDEIMGEVAEPFDSVRLEALADAYVRLVIFGPDGDPAHEHVLFPT